MFQVFLVNNAIAKYVTEELKWQSLPDDKHATNRLREFLKRKLNLEWIDHANITKIWSYSSLRITYENKSILIRLDDSRTKASLEMKGKIKYEFVVNNYNKKNEDSEEYLFIEVPQMTINEWAANFLIGYIQSRVPSFVFNLITGVTPTSEDFWILSQDKVFLNTLEESRIKFISQCETLTSLS